MLASSLLNHVWHAFVGIRNFARWEVGAIACLSENPPLTTERLLLFITSYH